MGRLATFIYLNLGWAAHADEGPGPGGASPARARWPGREFVCRGRVGPDPPRELGYPSPGTRLGLAARPGGLR
jgi:hypothetical protein